MTAAIAERALSGPKAVLRNILTGAKRPLTAAEVWAPAEENGLKSKRFMKQMLKQMRLAGQIRTVPLGGGKKHRSFGYTILGKEPPERAEFS
jgi:hypothetical protein